MKIKYIKDHKTGEKFYPVTHADGIIGLINKIKDVSSVMKWEDEPDDEAFEEEIQLVTYEEVKEFLNRQL